MRDLMRTGMFALSVCLSATADPRAALADSFTSFVQIACAPELGYFSIRRFGLSLSPQYIDRLQGSTSGAINSQGIYVEPALEKAPVECNLTVGAKTVRLRAAGVYKDLNKDTSSYRFIVDKIEVTANGKPLGDLFLNPFGFQAGIDFMEVFVEGAAIVRRCTYYEHVDDPALKAGCTREMLP
ncbi:MAG TPA: hypothetical protein VKY24_18210 [Reyranella sp.]|nr:hypothetical protein [Reyranella sp.]